MKPYPSIQVTRSSTPLVKFSLTFFEIDEDTNNVEENQSKFDLNFIFEIGKSKARNLFLLLLLPLELSFRRACRASRSPSFRILRGGRMNSRRGNEEG